MKKAIQISMMIVLFVATSCGSSKKVAEVKKVDPLIGTWAIVIKGTPQGDVPVKMILKKDENKQYQATLSSVFGDLPVAGLKIEANKMSGNFLVEGLDFSLGGTFKETVFEGSVFGMGESYVANGKKE